MKKFTQSPAYRWVIVGCCFVIIFACLGFCSSTKGLYLEPVTKALQLERSLYSVNDTLRYIASAIMNLLFGMLVLKFGPRKLVAGGFTCLCGAMLCSGAAKQVLPVLEKIVPCEAVQELSRDSTGALIVIERDTPLGDIAKTGTVVNADIGVALIKNIFFNKAPLHDGAMIIKNQRVYAAGCFLPLSTKEDIIKDLGTRHRAAIGMSENSDAIVIVVSEETGTISLAVDGKLRRNYDYSTLKKELKHILGESAVENAEEKNIGKKKKA